MSIRNIMAQAQQVYFNNYWKEKIPQYDENDGGFKWDSDNNKAVYNPRSNKLPSLEEMWTNYKNGAASRGVKADYLTFKKYYDRLKTKHNRDFLLDLQNAELTGISVDKIHDLLRENPELKQDLINATADGSDVSNQFKSHYFPPRESTFGEMIDENVLPITLAGLGTAAAVDYAMGVPGKTEYDEKLKKSQQIRDEAKAKLSKTKAKPGGDVYKGYVKDLKTAETNLENLKKDTPKARYTKVTDKFKTGTGRMPTVGYIGAGVAPTIVEEGLKKAGVTDESAAVAGDTASIMAGVGMLGMGLLRKDPFAAIQGVGQLYSGGSDMYKYMTTPEEPSK